MWRVTSIRWAVRRICRISKALKEGDTTIGERYLGQAIVKYGVIGKVSACSSCHGYNGRGAAPLFPVIGQQKYTYLVNQLNSWRAETRTNDPYAMMRKMAHNLTDEDIAQHRHLFGYGAALRRTGIRLFP